MSSGWQQGHPYFRRYGRELVSKPAMSLKESFGGATVERLGRETRPDPTRPMRFRTLLTRPDSTREFLKTPGPDPRAGSRPVKSRGSFLPYQVASLEVDPRFWLFWNKLLKISVGVESFLRFSRLMKLTTINSTYYVGVVIFFF